MEVVGVTWPNQEAPGTAPDTIVSIVILLSAISKIPFVVKML